MTKCTIWCLATKLYVFFAVVEIISILLLQPHFPDMTPEDRNQYITLYIGLLITWFLLLAWLCSTCNEAMALIFLLVPFIICFIFMLAIFALLIRINNRV